jgi:Ferritin-like domain
MDGVGRKAGSCEFCEPILEGGFMKAQRALFAGFVLAMMLAAGGVPAQEKHEPAQKGEMKSMGMSMEGMMKECREHHQAMTKSIDQMSKTLEGTKQSNDPAKMRAAIDQAQKHLAEMKEHMAMCSKMMGMMEKMEGMKGMMKDKSK